MIVRPILVKWMVQPALHKLTTDRSECEARPRMMWVVRAHGGNEGMLMVHVCVECTHLPSVRWAIIGLVVGTILVVGASVVRKWLVKPESRMAHCLMVLVLVLIVLIGQKLQRHSRWWGPNEEA
jgi:hypothetical protein